MAVPYYGDFAEDDTVNLPFNTFDSNDPSNSVTATDLVDGDIFVHKDGSATAITTDGATIDIDAPGVGAHMITIDTSVDAAYATGSEYAVRINGVTVDGGTINAWIGAFSIERAGGVLALLKGTNSLANIEDKIDIIDTNVDDIETAVITNAAGADISADILVIDNFVDDLETRIPDTISLANINAEIDTALNTAIPGGPTANSINQRVLAIDDLTQASGSGDLAAVLVDTDTTIPALLPAALVGGRMDCTIDATGMESGAVTQILTTGMTESYAANGATFSLAQAMYAMHQMLMDFSISGTAITVEQLDGTTAFTVTLDDATNPTSANRA